MPFRNAALLVFLLGITIMSLVYATPIPALDVDKLTDAASLVVQGEVIAIQNDTINGALMRVGTIHVDHVLKGAARADTVKFTLLLSEFHAAWDPTRNHAYGVFFLQPSSSGNFGFADSYYPFLPSFKGGTPSGGAPIDRVVSALSTVLWSAASTPTQRMSAIFIVSQSKSTASIAVLRDVLRDPSTDVQLSAAGALLQRNDITGLNLVFRALSHGSPDTSLPVYHNILFAISEGLKNPDAIPALKSLIATDNPEIRRAAASALMHTRSTKAIGPLLAALQDSDFQTQYYGAVGLAEITGQMDWRPNEDNFKAGRAKYLKHWREWANN